MWWVGYLREDIQDLKADMRENKKSLETDIRENKKAIERLKTDIDAKFEKVDDKIDKLRNLIFIGFGFLATLITIFKFLK